MKKSLSLLVAIAMVFSMFATLVSADAKSAGQKLQDSGVIKGTSEGLAEDQEWVRQDVTVLIARLLGKVEEAEAHANTHGFEDLDSKFYNGYVSWAKEKGYFIGKSATKFGVGDSITNQEFATVLLRVLNTLQGKTDEVDYAKAVETAAELGLISKDIDPKANAIRGDIYVSLVSALDYKINGKKIGTILGLKGYEVTELEIVSAKAVVKSAVSVEFNSAVESLKSEDVTVEDANGALVLVEKVTVDGAKATVALSDELESGKTYTLKIASATTAEGFVLTDASQEFKYQATTPATVEFGATTIAVVDGSDNELKVVVKDADGNDITANYSAGDFEVQSSNEGVIDGFDAVSTGDVIVNVKLPVNDDTTIETGNQIITVKAALTASIKDVSFGGDADDNDLKITVGETDDIAFSALDQADVTYLYPSASITDVVFKSLNPTRLVVDSASGSYTALQEGSATVQITAKVAGVSVSKSVIVTIQAEPKVSSISVSESSVKLVEGSELDYSFTVKALDQYNEKIAVAGATIEVVSSKTDTITATASGDIATGEATVELEGLKNGSSSVKVTVKADGKTFTKTVSVSQVAQNGFGGYVAEINHATLDVTPTAPKAADDATNTGVVSVYEKDKNGNKYAEASGVYFSSSDTAIATVDGAGTVTAVKAGTVTITVKAGSTEASAATVATVKVTVINSDSTINKVVQAKSTITVNATETNIKSKLFGKNEALVVTDQHGDVVDNAKIVIGDNVTIATSDSSVIDTDGDVNGEGKATITVAINKQFFVINVNVK